MTTLRQLCQEWLVSLPVWSECARVGAGLTVTVVINELVYPELVARWDGAPPLTASLDDAQQDQARTLLRWAGNRVGRQLRLVREGVDEGMDAARAHHVEVSANQLASKLAHAVQSLESTGEPLSAMELASITSAYLNNRPPRKRVVSRRAFAEYEPGYRRIWSRIGATNLAEFSYDELALGRDERPPFIRTRRESTWDGLGRSVYSRFRIAAGDARVAGTTDEVAQAEIKRACGRMGLDHESGLVALHSLFLGFTFGPSDSGAWVPPTDLTIDEAWKLDARPLRPEAPSSADPLRPRGSWAHADMAAYAQACVATFVRRQAQGRYLRWRGYLDEAREDAMRRAWMMCFEHDRRREVIDGPTAARIVPTAIFLGIPSGQADRRKQRQLTTRPEPLPADELIGAPAGQVDQARLAKTLAWLTEDPAFAHRLAADDEDAVAEYERQTASQGLVPWDTLLGYFGRGDS